MRLSPATSASPRTQARAHAAPERYQWEGVVREWISAPAIWIGATEEQEVAYLQHWKACALAEEHAKGERLMRLEREEERQQCWAGEEEERWERDGGT